MDNREISVNSEPMPMHHITPPPTPLRENHNHNHSSNLSHSSLDVTHYNNSQLEKILNVKLNPEIEDNEDLNTFCYSVIKHKFKDSIKLNNVLPSQCDKKNFKLKIYHKTNSVEIKDKIINTIDNPDPKISEFIGKSIDLLLLEQMETLERSLISLHNKTYHQINLTSTFKKRFFFKNYFKLNIELLSINFL